MAKKSLADLEQQRRAIEDQIERERTELASRYGRPFVDEFADKLKITDIKKLAKLVRAKGFEASIAALQ